MLPTATPADAALKARHRAVWALGDYPTVADTVIPHLGAELVEASGIAAGDQVLDVAAGSGNVALPAARTGARVVACDLTPELLEVGRQRAGAAGLPVEWREGDCESLPFADATFDAVLSCVGVMFAPHHDASAAELLRVCRPGGTIALASWTPEGFVGELFATMKAFTPAPPPGSLPPPLWGDLDHVTALLGAGVSDLRARREHVNVTAFDRPAAFRELFKHGYGPTVAAYRGLADHPERVEELDHALDTLAARHLQQGSQQGSVMRWEYLLVVADRA
jgi:SAM-dependent methyltransferase